MRVLNIRKLGLGVSAAICLGISFVAGWEGKRNSAYLDLVKIPTICYGHTKDVSIGDIKSDKECEELLTSEILYFNTIVDKHVTVSLSDNQRAALISFVYNVGESNFKRSTLLRKLNAGDYIGACNELPRWVYAGGKQVQGLLNRREAERLLCLGMDYADTQ